MVVVAGDVVVPSKDYARQLAAIWPEITAAIERTLRDDDPILGKAVDRFEAALAAYHGVTNAVGVGPGLTVVTGAHTFTGVVTAIRLAGAVPILVDVDPASGLPTPEAIDASITSTTRAVLAVHMYGHPVDATGIAAVARAAKIPF